jgi:hypothetical protein
METVAEFVEDHRRPTCVTLTYFKPSGKYYSEGEFTRDYMRVGNLGEVVYLPEVIEDVRAMQERGELPGLTSGRWEGAILITAEDGGQHLLRPW